MKVGYLAPRSSETESFNLPLARRLASTFLPFFDAIRDLKPCLFDLFLREGWNVRFMSLLFYSKFCFLSRIFPQGAQMYSICWFIPIENQTKLSSYSSLLKILHCLLCLESAFSRSSSLHQASYLLSAYARQTFSSRCSRSTINPLVSYLTWSNQWLGKFSY